MKNRGNYAVARIDIYEYGGWSEGSRPARPGDSFTGPDGVELVVVPRVATEAMEIAFDMADGQLSRNIYAQEAWSVLLSAMESSDDKG